MKHFNNTLLFFVCFGATISFDTYTQNWDSTHSIPMASAVPVVQAKDTVEINGVYYTLDQIATEPVYLVNGEMFTLGELIVYAEETTAHLIYAASELEELKAQREKLALQKANFVDSLNNEIEEKSIEIKGLNSLIAKKNSLIRELDHQLKTVRAKLKVVVAENENLAYEVSSLTQALREKGLLSQYTKFRKWQSEENEKMRREQEDLNKKKRRVEDERKEVEGKKLVHIGAGAFFGAGLAAVLLSLVPSEDIRR